MLITLTKPFATARGRDSTIFGNVLYPLGLRMVSRSFAQPDNPQSASQTSVRTYFTLGSQAFGALTDVERAAWDALAEAMPRSDMDGVEYNPTSKGTYVHVNSLRQIDGQAITDTAPSAVTQAAPTDITSVTIAGGNCTIVFAHSNADGFFMVEGTAKLPALQRRPRDPDYRLVSSVLADSIVARGASPQSVVIAVGSLHFPWAVADQVGIRITAISPGYVRGQSRSERQTIA